MCSASSFNVFWIHHCSLYSHVVLFVLKPAFWNRHCQVLHHDSYRVGSFIMYPFLTGEKKKGGGKHLPPGEEGGELLSEFSIPTPTSHGFRANIYKVSFTFNLRTWMQSHSQLFPACSCLHISRNDISAVCGPNPVKRKDLPAPAPLFAVDLDPLNIGVLSTDRLRLKTEC